MKAGAMLVPNRVGNGVAVSLLLGLFVTLALQVASSLPLLSRAPFTAAPHELLPYLILFASPALFLFAVLIYRNGRVRLQAIDVFYSLAIVVSFLSFLLTWKSINPVNPIYQVISSLYFYALVRLLSPTLLKFPGHIVAFVVGMMSIEALLALGQFFRGESCRGHFLNPNELAMYLTLGVPLALSLAWTRFRVRWVFGPLTFLFLFTIVLTDSRTALLALFLVLPLMGIWHFRKLLALGFQGGGRWIALGCVLIAVVGVLYLAWSYYLLKPRSVWGRLLSWEITLRILRDHWFAGVGFDNLTSSLTRYTGDYFQEGSGSETERLVVSYFGTALNDYLETAATLGFVGLVCYIPFWLLAAGRSLQILVRRSILALQTALKGVPLEQTDEGGMPSGLATSVLLFLVMGFFYYPGRLPPLGLVFNLCLALLVSWGTAKPPWSEQRRGKETE